LWRADDSHVGHFGECTVSFLEAAQHLVKGYAGAPLLSEEEGERGPEDTDPSTGRKRRLLEAGTKAGEAELVGGTQTWTLLARACL